MFRVVLYDLKEGVFVKEKNFMELFSEKNQLQKVMETNKKTEQLDWSFHRRMQSFWWKPEGRN